MSNTKTVSFRTQLKGTLSDFLQKEDMSCQHIEAGLLELVVALSHYTEEGESLFPQVVLCHQLDQTLRILQGSESIKIGEGILSKSIIVSALKKCAPLARNRWVIYIEKVNELIKYGVFCSSSSPSALDLRDSINTLTHEEGKFHIISVSQLAERAVELVGARSGYLHLYLSAVPDDAPSPQNAIELLVTACCVGVSDSSREQVKSFLTTTLSSAVRHCHGTLIGVISAKDDPTFITSDGVLFESPYDLGNLVIEHEKERSDQTLAALTAYSELLVGMLSSDGIVLLDCCTRIIGYNLFINDSGQSNNEELMVGGARRRAYRELCHLVDIKKLRGCFIRSSDGASDFYSREF